MQGSEGLLEGLQGLQGLEGLEGLEGFIAGRVCWRVPEGQPGPVGSGGSRRV